MQAKMLAHSLKGLGNTLTNGDRRHDDDELEPTVAFIELHDGTDIGVGLTRPCLHLDGEVIAVSVIKPFKAQRFWGGEFVLYLGLLNTF